MGRGALQGKGAWIEEMLQPFLGEGDALLAFAGLDDEGVLARGLGQVGARFEQKLPALPFLDVQDFDDAPGLVGKLGCPVQVAADVYLHAFLQRFRRRRSESNGENGGNSLRFGYLTGSRRQQTSQQTVYPIHLQCHFCSF